jgi:hypothetical protein
MSDPTNFDPEERRAKRQAAAREVVPSVVDAESTSPALQHVYSPALLGSARLEGRGNAPAREAIVLGAQKSNGNKAVQRALGRTSTPVQRSLLDDAADWASENTFRNPIDPLGVAHGLNQVFGERHTASLDGTHGSSPSLFYGGLRSAESTITGGVSSLASSVADIPVLGSVAQFGAEAVNNRAQITTGFLAGAGDFVGGIAGMVDNPMQTLGAFQQMAENNLMLPGFMNPMRHAHAAYDIATGEGDLLDRVGDAAHRWLDPVESMSQSADFLGNMAGGIVRPYTEAISEGRGYEATGRLAFDILSNMTGGGEASAASRGARTGRAAEAAGATARGADIAADMSRAGEGAQAASHGVPAAAHPPINMASPPTPRAPQPVMQMPAIDPAAVHPNMPQPGRWQAGPVGTPPVSNPVREMPAITPQQAASGQMPRDWGTYAPGRGRLPGEVGEMPAMGANPGLREPAGFGNNAGAIRPSGGPMPAEPMIGPAPSAASSPAVPRPSHEPVAYFPTEPGSPAAYPTMPASPASPAVPRPSHEPVAYFPTQPASPAAYPTIPAPAAAPIPYPNIAGPVHGTPAPLRGGGGHIPVSAGDEAGSLIGVASNPRMGPHQPYAPLPSQTPTRPGLGTSELPAGPSAPALPAEPVLRPPLRQRPPAIENPEIGYMQLVSKLHELRETELLNTVLRGHGFDPAQYLRDWGIAFD